MAGSLRPLVAVTVCSWAALSGCATVTEIRIHNTSPLDYADVVVGGQPFGDVPAGGTSVYRNVDVRFGYAVIKLRAEGRSVTGKTLNLGSERFTHEIDVIDLDAGHLAIEVVRD